MIPLPILCVLFWMVILCCPEVWPRMNHYPAIDVLMSISRLMSEVVDPAHREHAARLRTLLSTYRKAEDLINIGAYSEGSNPRIDEAFKEN